MRGIVIALLAVVFQSGQDLYQQALVQERAAGNLEAAIQLYQDAARNAAGDRALAAQALIGAARCYEMLGQTKAREIYQDVVRSYPDQQQQVAIARDRADALEVSGIREFAVTAPDGTFQRAIVRLRGQSPDRLMAIGPGMFWQALPRFDPAKPITVTGTLTRIDWVNPSVTFEIRTSGEPGSSYRIFGSNPARLAQEGFTRNLLKPGDLVVVDGLAGDMPNTIGQAVMTLPDGRKFELGLSVSGVVAPQR
jgi:hypothetical protein